MDKHHRTPTIVLAEDDPDDRLLARDALAEAKVDSTIHFVEDGEALLDYLLRKGKYADMANQPLPSLIVLDLNMPRKDGREALREIRANPLLRRIPIVILTTSRSEEDIQRSYDMGANSYIAKPVSFDKLVEVMRILRQYWLEVVAMPPGLS
jgi:CheY-like chemotaxis protein